MSDATTGAAGANGEIVEGGLADPTDLEPEQGELALAGSDDVHDRGEWEAAAAAVLRKARRMGEDDPDSSVWDKLARTTLDGIAVTPLGTPESLEDVAVAARPTRTGEWDIRSYAARDEARAVNEELLVDLNGGVTSLWLAVDASTDTGTDFAVLLHDVLLDLAPVVLDARGDRLGTARAFLAYAGGRQLHPGTNLGLDPASATVEQAQLAQEAGVLGFVVDATTVHDRGGSDAQELSWAMSTAVTYLRTLTDDGSLSVESAARLVEFRLAATDEQFPTIAKLRAARVLWARVLEASGAEPVPMRQHAVTSRPMMTRVDPWVNLLRTTVAAFAAGVGGAEAVTVLPFDSALGRPDALGRRIARNTSALLISESHLARVTDPAGGAYAVESLTADLAEAAWDLFVRLDGGADLDPLIGAVVEERERQVATRRRPITGVSEFPNLAESLPERAAYDDLAGVRSYAASYEAMRLEPPAAHVFLATMSSVAAHTARATFATNLLAAGGIAVDLAGPTESSAELVKAYDGQPVVCLAGPDPAYGDWGADAATALRGAGARTVIIAGASTSSTTEVFDAVDDSCATGVDALAFLTRTREALT